MLLKREIVCVAVVLTGFCSNESFADRRPRRSDLDAEDALTSVGSADGKTRDLFEKVRKRLVRDLMRRDFPKAREALDKARASRLAKYVELAVLAEDVDRIEQVLGRLRAGLVERAAKKRTLQLPASANGLREPAGEAAKGSRRLRVLTLGDDDVLVVSSTSRPARTLEYRLLSLPDATLLALILDTVRPELHPARAAAREDLGLLLLYTKGPRRAAPLLVDGQLDDETVQSHRHRLSRDGATWQGLKARDLEAHTAALSEDENGAPLDWAVLADEHRNLLLSLDPSARRGDRWEKVRSGFLVAEARRLPVATLFRATETNLRPDGSVHLRYEFTSPQEALDFDSVGNELVPAVNKRRLVVREECRFLEGSPFTGTLRVSASVSSYRAASPNLNVAFWTSPDDVVTFRDGERTLWLTRMRENPGTPDDYFLFGIGYHATVAQLLERPLEDILVARTREMVRLPAHVLLAGERSQTLHKDLGEGLWAADVGRLGAKVRFVVDWRPGRVTWTVNGSQILSTDDEGLDRVGRDKERSGSFSLVTNGSVVSYDSLEITGALNADWILEERERRAEVSLERLLESTGSE